MSNVSQSTHRQPDFANQYRIERHHPVTGWSTVEYLLQGTDEFGARRSLAEYRRCERGAEYRLARRPAHDWQVMEA